MNEIEFIIVSKLKCPDGKVLISKSKHDYRCHEIDGKRVCLDGGTFYRRIVGDSELVSQCEDISITTNSPIEEIREEFEWGAVRNNKVVRIKLKDLSNDHIKNILKTQSQVPDYIRTKCFEAELEYRKENNIKIKDS